MMEILRELAGRFSGFDLQYRRCLGAGWKKAWRARLVVNKNERDEYRLCAFGDSAEAAIAWLHAEVYRRDGK